MSQVYQLDTTMEVDLEDVERLIYDESFTSYLLNHSTYISTSAFILDTLYKKIDELREEDY